MGLGKKLRHLGRNIDKAGHKIWREAVRHPVNVVGSITGLRKVHSSTSVGFTPTQIPPKSYFGDVGVFNEKRFLAGLVKYIFSYNVIDYPWSNKTTIIDINDVNVPVTKDMKFPYDICELNNSYSYLFIDESEVLAIDDKSISNQEINELRNKYVKFVNGQLDKKVYYKSNMFPRELISIFAASNEYAQILNALNKGLDNPNVIKSLLEYLKNFYNSHREAILKSGTKLVNKNQLDSNDVLDKLLKFCDQYEVNNNYIRNSDFEILIFHNIDKNKDNNNVSALLLNSFIYGSYLNDKYEVSEICEIINNYLSELGFANNINWNNDNMKANITDIINKYIPSLLSVSKRDLILIHNGNNVNITQNLVKSLFTYFLTGKAALILTKTDINYALSCSTSLVSEISYKLEVIDALMNDQDIPRNTINDVAMTNVIKFCNLLNDDGSDFNDVITALVGYYSCYHYDGVTLTSNSLINNEFDKNMFLYSLTGNTLQILRDLTNNHDKYFDDKRKRVSSLKGNTMINQFIDTEVGYEFIKTFKLLEFSPLTINAEYSRYFITVLKYCSKTNKDRIRRDLLYYLDEYRFHASFTVEGKNNIMNYIKTEGDKEVYNSSVFGSSVTINHIIYALFTIGAWNYVDEVINKMYEHKIMFGVTSSYVPEPASSFESFVSNQMQYSDLIMYDNRVKFDTTASFSNVVDLHLSAIYLKLLKEDKNLTKMGINEMINKYCDSPTMVGDWLIKYPDDVKKFINHFFPEGYDYLTKYYMILYVASDVLDKYLILSDGDLGRSMPKLKAVNNILNGTILKNVAFILSYVYREQESNKFQTSVPLDELTRVGHQLMNNVHTSFVVGNDSANAVSYTLTHEYVNKQEIVDKHKSIWSDPICNINGYKLCELCDEFYSLIFSSNLSADNNELDYTLNMILNILDEIYLILQ